MDYEKKYKEALSRAATELENCGADKSLRNMIYAIFPDELKESEDERIRKALIRFHKSTIDVDGIKGDDIIAWLEKQGNNTPTIIWHNIDEKPEEMKELFCEWESDDATWHDVAFYDEESHTFRHAKMPINVTKWIYVDELLEKQGEQKPTSNTRYKVKAGDSLSVNAFDYEYASVTQKDFVPKVEPKFHKGDWVVYECGEDSVTLQIKNIVYGTYEFTDDSTLNVVNEDILRLWSIKDAKDGDVVVDKSDGTIGIFESIGHHPDGGSFNDPSYCFLHCRYDDGYFFADFEDGNMMTSDDVIPATKEQRDTLEKAMADAGYTFDFEKKELKKIEQNPTWSDEDEENLQHCCMAISVDSLHTHEDKQDMEAWLKRLKNRIGG